MNNVPYSWKEMNIENHYFKPSDFHTNNAQLVHYFCRYLMQKVISVFDITGMPEFWSRSYFYYTLFLSGFIAVFDDQKFGTIPQWCTLSGYNIFYEPTTVHIAHPLIDTKELKIGKDCELVKMMPDYGGIADLVTFYADMLACSAESAGINLVNSRFSHIFAAENSSTAESFKKLIDQIYSGQNDVVADKQLFDDDGNLKMAMFNAEPKQVYIAGQILNDMTMWDSRFNADIGIPNVNVTKASGISADEINANNIDTHAKSYLWKETINTGLDKVNSMFGLNLKCELRFDNVDTLRGGLYGEIVDTRTV